MVQVFMLVLMIGIGEDRYEVEEKMYFRSIELCNEVARHVAKRWGHWSAKDQATSYCVPHSVKEGTIIY